MKTPDYALQVAVGTMLALMLWVGIAHAEPSIPIKTLVLEAGGEGFEGMRAVGEVIRNRANKAHISVGAVCLRPKQFSCFNDPLEAKRRLSRVEDKTWKVAEEAWKASATSLQTRRATHYHTTAVSPYWAKGHTPCARIGHHVFYNDIR